jgi:hypothetical protein
MTVITTAVWLSLALLRLKDVCVFTRVTVVRAAVRMLGDEAVARCGMLFGTGHRGNRVLRRGL